MGTVPEKRCTQSVHRPERNRTLAQRENGNREAGVPGPYFGQSEDWPLDLNAPAVFFGVLESALHFVVEHVVEDGAGDGFLAGFGDVGGADACV